MADRFCALCSCSDHLDMPKDLRKNWTCPVIERKICKVCCQIEVDGGFSAQDTFRAVCNMSHKTPQAVHAACVACRHGGKSLLRPPKIVSISRGSDGKVVTSGREIERIRRHDRAIWERKARWLKGNINKSLLRRMNVERGYKPS